jgi:hypothetical protein
VSSLRNRLYIALNRLYIALKKLYIALNRLYIALNSYGSKGTLHNHVILYEISGMAQSVQRLDVFR